MNKQSDIGNTIIELLHGSIVSQILDKHKNVDTSNAELKILGREIGSRMTEEYLFIEDIPRCSNFSQTVDQLLSAFTKIFGIECSLKSSDEGHAKIELLSNPLSSNLNNSDIPQGFNFFSFLLGAVEGGMELLNHDVECLVNNHPGAETDTALIIELIRKGSIKRKLLDYD